MTLRRGPALEGRRNRARRDRSEGDDAGADGGVVALVGPRRNHAPLSGSERLAPSVDAGDGDAGASAGAGSASESCSTTATSGAAANSSGRGARRWQGPAVTEHPGAGGVPAARSRGAHRPRSALATASGRPVPERRTSESCFHEGFGRLASITDQRVDAAGTSGGAVGRRGHQRRNLAPLAGSEGLAPSMDGRGGDAGTVQAVVRPGVEAGRRSRRAGVDILLLRQPGRFAGKKG